jgi:hypothetical protein
MSDSLGKDHVSGLISASDQLLKRTDTDEIYVNQTARDRLSSLLQAVRLLRSCITAISREGTATGSQPVKRTIIPRPDSLEPVLGEIPRSGRKSPIQQASSYVSGNKGIGAWLASVPSYEEAQPLSYSVLERPSAAKRLQKPSSHAVMTPSRSTFYTDDGVSSNRTLIPPESRLRKSYSWCTERSGKASTRLGPVSGQSSKHVSTVSSCDVSIFHKKITSDRIAVTKAKRKDLDPDQRSAVDKILANIPSEATSAEVERVIWEGANPMAVHPEFGYFFIKAAYEMIPDVLGLLMEFGADITRTVPAPTLYYSAMHAATLGRQLDTVRLLASIGHSIDSPNHLGETPLHLAARTPGAYEIARVLVYMGADVNHEARDGQTPLQVALKTSRLESRERSLLIEMLLAHGAEGEVKGGMERRGNEKGRTVLGL